MTKVIPQALFRGPRNLNLAGIDGFGDAIADIRNGGKIIKKRTEEDGIDGEQFVREGLPAVLARGKCYKPSGDPRKRKERVTLVLDEDQVTLSMFRFGKRETWVLTGYKTDETKKKKKR